MIAVLSEGALRDAISILERCTQDEADKIDEDQIRELVGIPKLTYIRNLTNSLFERNPEQAITEVQNIISQGKDLDNFLWEIIKYIKDILVYKSTKKLELYSKEELEYINKLSERIEKPRLLEIIYNLSELANTMKWSTQKNIIFETGIIKECLEIKPQQVVEVVKTSVQEKQKTQVKPQGYPVQEKTVKKESTTKSETPIKGSGKYVPYWTSILDKIKAEGKIMIYTNLIGTKAVLIDDMTVGIEFPSKLSEFAKKVLNEYENKAIIEKLISMEQGNTMRVKYLGNEPAEEKTKDGIENLANKLNIPINIIDE